MSGFLKRIANSAIRRETGLHPLVDSLYVPDRREEMPASIEETQTVVLQPQENQRQKPLLAPFADRTQAAPDNETARTNDGLPNEQKQNPDGMPPRATHPELNSAERGIFQPLLGRVPAGQQMPAEKIESPAEANRSIHSVESLHATAQSNSMNAPVESMTEADAKRGNWAYQPLVSSRADSEAQTFPAPREHVPSAQILQAAAARKEASTQALAQRSAQQARAPIQPEEIQIHIGRIEVIATPPPAPRPAPAPARRGQSLDEYLSSSSGRSR